MKSLILLVFLLIIPGLLGHVYANHDEKVRLLVIQLGSGCTFCPELYELLEYDNSRPEVSGGFSNDTGTWIRDKPVFIEHWKMYQMEYGQDIRFVEMYPNLQWNLKTKTIVISDYIDKDKKGKLGIINTTSHIAHYWNMTINRNMGGCSTATIDSHDWKNILDDTIRFMHYDCDIEMTNVETIKKIIVSNKTKTVSLNLEKWLDKRTQTIGEYCADKYPCVYQYEGPAWIWNVVEWYKNDQISKDELLKMLAWSYMKITNVLPIIS